MDFETKKASELIFPTVTICNYGPVYTSEMYERFREIVDVSEHEFKMFYYLVLSNRRDMWRQFDNIHSHFKKRVLKELAENG